MLTVPSAVRILLARKPVDFRKAHDGLLAIVRDQFGDEPFDGSLFVFLNKRRDRIKLLQWDRDGFWLHYKRLETGTYRIDVNTDAPRVELTRAQFLMLLEGIDIEKRRIRKPFREIVRNGGRSAAV